MRILTKHGHNLFEVSSALQKAVRRADTKVAVWMALELATSGYHAYCWKRLLVVSAEDCAGALSAEVEALERAFLRVQKKGEAIPPKGRVFVAKAVLLLCAALKTRDADHAVCLFYDLDRLAPDKVAKALAEEAGRTTCDLPDYTFDCHTQKGRKAGRTKAEFFPTEFDALKPRDQGEFDWTVAGNETPKP